MRRFFELINRLHKVKRRKDIEGRADDPIVGDLVTLIDIGTTDEDEASVGIWSDFETPRPGYKPKKSMCTGRFRTNDIAVVLEVIDESSSARIFLHSGAVGWVCSNWLKKVEM